MDREREGEGKGGQFKLKETFQTVCVYAAKLNDSSLFEA